GGAGRGLVLVRVERAEQHVDRRRALLRTVSAGVRGSRVRDRALAGTIVARPAAVDWRAGRRGLSTVLARLGGAVPDRHRSLADWLCELASVLRVASRRGEGSAR